MPPGESTEYRINPAPALKSSQSGPAGDIPLPGKWPFRPSGVPPAVTIMEAFRYKHLYCISGVGVTVWARLPPLIPGNHARGRSKGYVDSCRWKGTGRDCRGELRHLLDRRRGRRAGLSRHRYTRAGRALDLRGDDLPVVERHPAQPARAARVLIAA